MKQTPHPLPTESASQCNLILAALRRARGQWVTMSDLIACGGGVVHSRISDLRARGHEIDQYNDYYRHPRTNRPAIRSHYRLVRDAASH